MVASKTVECVYEGDVLKPPEKVEFKDGCSKGAAVRPGYEAGFTGA